ncbi:MAG: aspartate-semialdehyde dehydrogenase [Acidobacteriota bacterium]
MKVGFIGWRGMVGSVLRQRLESEGDLPRHEWSYFSTSAAGGTGPDGKSLADAHDVDRLAECDVVMTCQGGSYTESMHPRLRDTGWDGYWIDAASALRMAPDSVIVLDPVNRALIDRSLDAGVRDLIGGNCTVSLMLMATAPLFSRGWVEWMSSMTYQAASGAGAQAVKELAAQMRYLGDRSVAALDDPEAGVADVDEAFRVAHGAPDFPTDALGFPLAGSLLPWIDRAVEHGQSREEWKGEVETNKILALEKTVPVDGICVRIAAMRCHAQALLFKLTEDVPLEEIESVLGEAHRWCEVVPNTPEASKARLTPAAVTGSLQVPVGRLRKTRFGPEYLSLFTVGDQLLWGAAEPLRRALEILRERAG